MKNSGKLLNQKGLQALALRYVSRYATTRYKLSAYLHRKLKERIWDDEKQPAVEQIAEHFAELGFIDDALFAESRARSLINKGYGKKRVEQSLYQAGIKSADSAGALGLSEQEKWNAARTYARKKSIGPFAQAPTDRDRRQKQLQAFIRAGHGYDIASRFVFANPGEKIEEDQ